MNARNLIIKEIDELQPILINISHDIHSHPEISNEEFFAAELLGTKLKAAGFEVTHDIAGHATGFIATKVSSKPGATIGILAEYDALPGLGHACGHNIIAASSLGAALALSKVLAETGGTLKVFGCPAEEGGINGSAKASYVKAGLFEHVDLAMMIHPSSFTQRTPESLAIAPMDFEFFGSPAHAASCPEEGINALDALLLFYNGINALRQQLTSDVRIHGVILDGGTAPNIIPDYTRARFYIRAANRTKLDVVVKKVKAIANGSALSTGCTTKYTHIQHVLDNLKPHAPLDDLFVEALTELGESLSDTTRGVGSTDVGNVSHVIPTIHPMLSICDTEIPVHTETFKAACIAPLGDKAVITGAKALALTALKVLSNPTCIQHLDTSL